MQRDPLATNYVYHIYNRGTEKRDIFLDSSYYDRFISVLEHSLKYGYPYSILKYRLEKARTPEDKQNIFACLESKRIKPSVEIISFCLMPNHYHLTLKQLTESGISNFMRRIGVSYTNYFNNRLERTGRLFETAYKTIMVESDEQLLHLTRYQHLNPHVLGLETPEELINYQWSSLSTYLGDKRFPFVKPNMVIGNFRKSEDYLDFVMAEIDKFESCRLEATAIDDDFGWFARFRALKKDYREQLRQQYLEMLL